MAFDLTNAQHKKLDEFLGKVLDGYRDGEFTKPQAIGALAHVFTAGVIDNEGEVRAWLERPDVFERWRSDSKNMP